ncbi:hypothetical protein BDV59DRAFT_207522 [Aspergillus ambiguus]|uniref:Zn(II)2Cys6 transcription factor n=1 Tax=Aspergillus ambiguus TaxID=176160 RepID=UPI003CCE243A
MPPGARASRSCGNCRAIKRRCDKQHPHCGQCIRMREECSGYRDTWELFFHDQTSHTIERSKAIQVKSANSTRTAIPHPAYGLCPSPDEAGVNYFLHHFVIGGPSPSRGYLNYVPAVYSADGHHPTLVASMAAVGLAALASSTQRPELVIHARTKYREAINNVNSALASPTESVRDSTLMSVISLSLFEHVSDFKIWFRHVQGATALIVARGKSQFSRPASVLMFNQVRADMAAACIHSLQPFPKDMLELQKEAAKQIGASSAFWLLGVLATRCTDLLSGVHYNKRSLEDFLEETVVLQRDFQHVMEIFTREEPYTTNRKCNGAPEIIYEGRCDFYRTSWAIRIWNNSRMLQIIVCEIMFHLLNKLLAKRPTQRTQIEMRLQETVEILSELGDDILATVPQALGFVSSSKPDDISADFSSTECVSGGHMLTWCLYTVGKSPATRSKTRKWIMKRLQDIGQNSGIAMALQFVDDIDEIDRLAGRV